MSEEEVKKIIFEVVARVKPVGPSDFGRVMGEVMKVLKGKAEAGLVSKILKEALGRENG